MLNHIAEIAGRVKKAGNDVALICRETEVKLQSVSTYRLDFSGASVPFIRGFLFPFASVHLFKQFDLVHTQYHPDVFVGNLVSRTLGKPHVFTYHGFAPVRVWNSVKQRVKMVDHRIGAFFALRSNVDKIISVSNYLKEELVKKYFVDENQIKVIYNGVDLARFNLDVRGENVRNHYGIGDCPVVLYLGRLAPYKGVQFLVQAIPRVLETVTDAKFLIGGGRRYDIPDFARLIRRLKVRDSVIFTKYVPDSMVPNLYACCDVFCYPSLWEGFGLTPAEAQACGKPVVAFKNCAIPEVVKDGITGLLVEPRNVEALAEALITLLQNEGQRNRMAVKASERTRQLFSWDRAAESTIQVYEEVTS